MSSASAPELETDYQSYLGEDCVGCFLKQIIQLQEELDVFLDEMRFIRHIYN